MSWTTLDLRKDLKTMEKALNNESDPKRRDLIIKYIADLKYDIACEELQAFEIKENSDEELDEDEKALKDVEMDLDEGTCYGDLTHDISDIEKYRLYYPFVEKHIEICDKSLEKDYTFMEQGDMDLNEDDINSLTHDFFKDSTDKFFYDKYLKYEKNNKKILHMDQARDSEDGYFFYFPISNTRYVKVGLDGAKERTLTSLAHEVGHVLGSFINEGRYCNQDVFYEIESVFFELLSEEYYFKKLNKKLFKEELIDNAYTYDESARRIMAFKRVTDKTFDNMNKVKNPYKYYGRLSKKEEYYKNIDVDDKMKYLFSYLVAVELLEIYKVDKDKALYLLKEIVKENKDKTEYQRITENIELNNLMNNHVKTLKRF